MDEKLPWFPELSQLDARAAAKDRRDRFVLGVLHAVMQKGGYIAEGFVDGGGRSRHEATAHECRKFADALIAELDKEK